MIRLLKFLGIGKAPQRASPAQEEVTRVFTHVFESGNKLNDALDKVLDTLHKTQPPPPYKNGTHKDKS